MLWSLQHVQLPEGKDCVLKCTPNKKCFHTAYLGCYTEVDCSMNFNVLTVCKGNQRESEMYRLSFNSPWDCYILV